MYQIYIKHMDRLLCLFHRALLIMKLTTIILLVTLLQVNAEGLAQKITLKQNQVPLTNIFKELKAQTGYNFLYTESLLRDLKPVSIQVKDMELTKVLEQLLSGQSIAYEVENKTIILSRSLKAAIPQKSLTDLQFPVRIIEPSVPIAGYVVGPDGQPLPGVTVQVKGSKKGTSTTAMGNFKLDVAVGDVLEISSMGLVAMQVRYSGKGFEDITKKDNTRNISKPAEVKYSKIVMTTPGYVHVQLVQSESPLDEVQVMAYGKTSKRISTGNISKVTNEELNMAPVTDPLMALQGRVPGMIVTPSITGKPGESIKIQIRGRTQIDEKSGANQEPLYIVDGIPMAAQNGNVNNFNSGLYNQISAFSMMNMGDIESFEVLKDADATAIYGSRGASGVILITTKKGKQGATRYNFNLSTGGSKMSLPDMLSTKDYVQYRKEAFKNDGVTMTKENAFDLLVWDTTRNENLMEKLLGGTAGFTRLQASVSGGGANIQYNVGLGYNRTTDISPKPLPSSNMSVSANINSTSNNKKFVFNLSTSFSNSENKSSRFSMGRIFELPPNLKLYEADGSIAWNEGNVKSGFANPLAALDALQTTKLQTYNVSSLLSYALLKGLTIRANIGYNQDKSNALSTSPLKSLNPLESATNIASASWGNNEFTLYNIEPQLEYVKDNVFKGRLTVLAGASYQDQKNQGSSITAQGYTNDEYVGTYVGLSSGSFTSPTSNFSHYKYAAAFARVSYNLANTYMLNISGRRDGSSRFGQNYRYSNFGSVGAAWALSEEKFFPKNSILSFAKIRASYGLTGNDKIGDYKFLDLYENNFFNGPYNGQVAMTPTSFFKHDLHWELTKKLEFGLDAGLFKDRLNFTAVWFKFRTSDHLVQYPLPAFSGFSTIVANLENAIVDNTGLEFSLSGTALKRGDFEWRSNFNVSIPKNVLKRFDSQDKIAYPYYTVGKSLEYLYKLKYTGVDPMTGQHTVLDVNNDGKIDLQVGSPDVLYYGNKDPRFYGGWQNDFRYKQFSINMFFQFDRKIRDNYEKGTQLNFGAIRNITTYLFNDRWRQHGDVTINPRATQTGYRLNATQGDYLATESDRLLDKLTLVKLATVQASYALPAILLKKLNWSQASVFAQGQNLWSFYLDSKISPETDAVTEIYPLKTITIGLHLNF